MSLAFWGTKGLTSRKSRQSRKLFGGPRGLQVAKVASPLGGTRGLQVAKVVSPLGDQGDYK